MSRETSKLTLAGGLGRPPLRAWVTAFGLGRGVAVEEAGLVAERGCAVDGKALGLVVQDGVEEGVVICGAVGGNFPQEEMDVTGGADYRTLHGVLRGEGGVIALDGCAGGRTDCRAGGKMEGHVGVDFERGAEFDRGNGGTWGWFCRQIGQA